MYLADDDDVVAFQKDPFHAKFIPVITTLLTTSPTWTGGGVECAHFPMHTSHSLKTSNDHN